LVELLRHSSSAVQTPALRAVGNIATGDDFQTQTVISCGLLTVLPTLFNHPKKSIRKEVMWTISNITAGNRSQIQEVIDAQIFPQLIGAISSKSSESPDVKKEIFWSCANALEGGSDEQVKYLINSGVIEPFCDVLTIADAKVLSVGLEGLQAILRHAEKTETLEVVRTQIEEYGGVEYLENLQTHPNTEIYEKAVNILENYFIEEEDEV